MSLDLNVGNITEPVSGRYWDSGQVRSEVARRIARLQHCGLEPGDRVFLLFGNKIEFFAELLAIWQLGACAVPVDPRLTQFEIDKLVTAASPKMVIVDDATPPSQVNALAKAKIDVIDTTETGTVEAIAGSTRLDDEALILFTSGSTGAPKGVVHTHRTLRARWTSLQECLGIEPFARTLCLLPTFFGHGLICNCLFPWLSGQDLFIAPAFRPDILMQLGSLVDTHSITFMSSVPSMWQLALKLSPPPKSGSLQRVHCGSAPLSAQVWEDIRAWAGTRQVCNTYGITETGSWVGGLSNADCAADDGLIGEGWGADIKVLRATDTSAPLDLDTQCAPGEEGYIWLNTPALMKGYFQRDDLTRQAVIDGWFLTGDIGLIDHGGRLRLRGREREEINKGGMKIYPSDVDAVVERFEHTADVCTFAIPDEIYGQSVGLAVALKIHDDDTIRALHQWMKQHLADHKMPSRWWVVDTIARTSRGKINRENVSVICCAEPSLDLPGILSAK